MQNNKSWKDKLFLSVDVRGPRITVSGLEEKASTGNFMLIIAIHAIGKEATRHQIITNNEDEILSAIGCFKDLVSIIICLLCNLPKFSWVMAKWLLKLQPSSALHL